MNKLILIEGNPETDNWRYKFYKEYTSEKSGKSKPIIDVVFNSDAEILLYIISLHQYFREEFYLAYIEFLRNKLK